MRILITTQPAGEVWAYVVELARQLSRRGIDILVASAAGPVTEAQRRQLCMPNVDLEVGHWKPETLGEDPEDVQATGQWLLGLARSFRPHVVHLNQYSHAHLDWRRPVLLVAHSCMLSWHKAVRGGEPGPRWNTYRSQVRRGLRAAQMVVAPTRAMIEQIRTLYGPPTKERVIASGRDGSLPNPGQKEPYIFSSGQWCDEARNLLSLCRAAAQVPWPVYVADDSQTTIGGEHQMPSVRHLVTHSQEELAGWLSRAGIYALPARYEPSGLAALDAAAAGCALVLGDIDSFREYWDGAAVFVPPNEPDAIGRTLRHLIQDEPLRLCLAQQARQRARQFRPQRMAMEYIGAYHHLLHEAGQNVPVQQPALVTLDVHMSFSDGV